MHCDNCGKDVGLTGYSIVHEARAEPERTLRELRKWAVQQQKEYNWPGGGAVTGFIEFDLIEELDRRLKELQ